MANSTKARRGMPARIGSILLTLAAAGGAICIVLVILAVVFHISLVMFKTGSMSPTIPQGSVALVRQVPASEVKVGEVVTVSRTGQLPISHRVTSVKPGDTAGTRILTLRGDANPTDDPVPYTVHSASVVFWSAPGVAYFIVWLSNPLVAGAIALGVSALVTWAFWPSGGGPRTPRKRSRVADHASTIIVVLIASGLAAGWVALPAQSAWAEPTEQIIQGEVIRLVSIGDTVGMAQLTPGIPALWQVGVSAQASAPGTITLTLLADGPLAESPIGLTLGVESCDVRWVGSTCSSGQRTLLSPQPAAGLGGVAHPLGTMATADQRWILVSASVPNAASTRAGTSDVRITATGMGDSQTSGPPGGGSGVLGFTGTDPMAPLLFALASLLVGLGFSGVASVIARRRRDDPA
ncbi:MAG: hypothetical protein JWQ12_2383 [Glaciihabitans sp.]|nr:hypothetical protein [Glaciihabitans sp.]